MSKLQILRSAVKRPNSGKKYVETFNFVAFHSKINLRRKLNTLRRHWKTKIPTPCRELRMVKV